MKHADEENKKRDDRRGNAEVRLAILVRRRLKLDSRPAQPRLAVQCLSALDTALHAHELHWALSAVVTRPGPGSVLSMECASATARRGSS